jgi:hypothetical protein
MATPNIVPRADSEGGIGTASKYWASAYIDTIYVGAGKVGRDADNNLDFSTDNNIFFKINGSNEIVMDANRIYPATSDGSVLGHPSYHWSDLFLASGAVINFDNGDVTLTHAANNLAISGGNLQYGDNVKAAFGNAGDLNVYHDATNSYIDNEVTGDLYIRQLVDDKDIIFQSDDGSGGITSYLTLDGSVTKTIFSQDTLHSDSVEAMFGTGEDLKIKHDSSDSYIRNFTGDLNILNAANNKDIVFKSDDGSGDITTYFQLDGSAASGGTVYTVWPDNSRIAVGTDKDFNIKHDGSTTALENSTGSLYIQNQADDQDIIFTCDNGAGGSTTYFYLDGSSATHDGSATTGLYTNWPDYSRISMGTSHDLQIYHDSTNSNIINAVGNLAIQNNADDGDIKFFSDDGSGGVTEYFRVDGGNSQIRVYKELNITDSISATFGNSGDLSIQHDSNNSYITANGTGDLYIKQMTADKDITFQCDDGSGGETEYFRLDGSVASGGTVVTNFPDNSQIAFGSSRDFRIYHDGNNTYFDQNGTGALYIRQTIDNQDIIFECDDGSGGNTAYITIDGSAEKINLYKSIEFTGGGFDFGDDGSGADASFYGDTSGRLMKWDASDNSLIFNDNTTAKFGNGGDMQLSHDGSNSKITNMVGHLSIINYSDDSDIVFETDNGSGGNTEYFRLDGGITSIVASKDLLMGVDGDGGKIKLGASQDLQIYHDGTDSRIYNDTGDFVFRNNQDDGDVKFQCDDGSGGVTTYLTLDGGDVSTIVSTIKVMMPNLPTSNPSTAGQLWNDSGTLKISAG